MCLTKGVKERQRDRHVTGSPFSDFLVWAQRLSGTLPLLNASGLAVLSLARNSISGDTSGLSGVDDSALRSKCVRKHSPTVI